MRVNRISPPKKTFRTWIMASKMEMSRVVRSTLKPAATRGVTWSNAALRVVLVREDERRLS
jgi:hypothetical protein